MNRLLKTFLLLAALIPSIQSAHGQTRCLGGDGGVPMGDISSGFKFDNEVIPTNGLVKEFFHWDQKNTVVYRNHYNEVHSLALENGADRFLGQSGVMISRIVDPLEKFITTAHYPWFLDASKPDPMWVHYNTPAPISRNIFWHGDVLYSLAAETMGTDKQRLNVLSYRAGQTFSQSCVIPNTFFETYYVAEGHEYPYVYLYSLTSTLTGTKLHQWRIKLLEIGMGDDRGKCKLEDLNFYHESLPGAVKGVFHFKEEPGSNVHTFAISVDHPKRSILYDDGASCSYLDLQGKDAMILNANQPIVATWAKGEGLGLHYLNAKKEVRFWKNLLKESISEENLWMTDNGRTMFVAAQPSQCEVNPHAENCQGRMIVKLNLPEAPKPD